MCGMSNSADLSVVLTLEKSSSMGLKSSEYGGRKSTGAGADTGYLVRGVNSICAHEARKFFGHAPN